MPFEIAAATATIKAVANIAKEAGKIDLYQKVLDLQQILLEATSENLRLVTENHSLTERIRRLERDAESSREIGQLNFDGQVYWTGEPSAATGPFCPRCKDEHQRLARMTDRGNGFTCCTVCSHGVANTGFKRYGLSYSRDAFNDPLPRRGLSDIDDFR
jgi:hypothetical protein